MNRSDILRLFKILHRRRWMAFAVGLITITIVLLVAFILPNYYRATAVVVPSEAAIHNPLNLAPTAFADGFRINRQVRQDNSSLFIGLAKSPEVLRRASENLGLEMPPKTLSKFVVLEPAFGSAFGITALAQDPEEAIRRANGIAETLREYYREESRIQASEQYRRLRERLDKIRATMERAKDDVESLRKQSVVLPTASEGDNPYSARIIDLQSEQDSVRAQASDLAERIRRTEEELARQPETVAHTTSTSDTPMTRSLRSELARLEQELVSARIRYTDKHREVIRLNQQIADVKARLAEATSEMDTQRTVVSNPLKSALETDLVRLRIDDAALKARIAELNRTIAENQQKLSTGSAKAVDLAARMADYRAAQEAYQTVSELLQAAAVEQETGSQTAEIQIVQRAATVDGPAPRQGPTRQEILMLGIMLSVVLGIGAAVAAESLDSSLRSAEEVESVLRLPLAATIPEIIGEEKLALPQITRTLPVSPYAECYRFLRTSILAGGQNGALKSLMLTAASPSQGNSTTVANLAISLAEAGRRVVLLDVDLRRPVQHRNFGLDNSRGLTDVLSGRAALESVIQKTDIDGLYVVPAGPASDNPSALVNSEKMREVIRHLNASFEFLLVDSPPVMAFSDSITLAGQVEAVTLVVRVGDSSRGNEIQAKTILEKAGAKILGVVVNGLSSRQIDSFQFHAHYYQRPALPGPVENDQDENIEQEGNTP